MNTKTLLAYRIIAAVKDYYGADNISIKEFEAGNSFEVLSGYSHVSLILHRDKERISVDITIPVSMQVDNILRAIIMLGKRDVTESMIKDLTGFGSLGELERHT